MTKPLNNSEKFASSKPASNGRDLLAQFVRQTQLEKGLTASDVERLSKGQISDSYVGAIAQGKIQNLSISKLKALARGLDVNEWHLIALASRKRPTADLPDESSPLRHLCEDYAILANQEKPEVDLLIGVLHREIQRRLFCGRDESVRLDEAPTP